MARFTEADERRWLEGDETWMQEGVYDDPRSPLYRGELPEPEDDGDADF